MTKKNFVKFDVHKKGVLVVSVLWLCEEWNGIYVCLLYTGGLPRWQEIIKTKVLAKCLFSAKVDCKKWMDIDMKETSLFFKSFVLKSCLMNKNETKRQTDISKLF